MIATAQDALTLSSDEINAAAQALHTAERTRVQLRQLSLHHPGMGITDAYAIQRAWVHL
jgi:2-oxo-hept-3-ene-1,7-dioate hydratase